MTFDTELQQSILAEIIIAAKNAGQAILRIYNNEELNIQTKSDDSPLTQADLAAHRTIINHLTEKYSEIPCLSEESQNITFIDRKDWESCFIIDPLDGTKEFIARNDDFTVNIALVHQGKPIIGVIYVPVFDTLYYAATELGAFKQQAKEEPVSIAVRRLPQKDGQNYFTVVASRRHGVEKVASLCQNFANFELTSRGSSLKMCLVAEGSADLYPRLAPTSEWDTAAAQVIVEQAGGQLVTLDYQPLVYNQKESLLNPHFLVLGDAQFDWQQHLVIPN
ncbi:3'(2'),5'-bisphosphate nucleotidase CysQ [Aliikangiella maris]|uniref:3'(2'),5'-bisphosphate nucleotidase CysQ n=2 Tax=Aliikangiella maris TaxID=3162458 RepID=A0ABV2BXS4_9GAMM